MISSQKKLIVGCTSSIVQTVASTFDAGKTVNMEVDSLSTTLYILPLPTLDRAYCYVTTTRITNAKLNGVASSSAVSFPVGCVQPCLTFTVSTTTPDDVFTF